jgi:hypothetical protein
MGAFARSHARPLGERHVILADYQRSIRRICRPLYVEPATSLAFVGMTGIARYRCTFAREACAALGSREPGRAASRPCGFDPSRGIRCPSPEALGPGSRRVPRRRYADAPAAAIWSRRRRVTPLALRELLFPSFLVSNWASHHASLVALVSESTDQPLRFSQRDRRVRGHPGLP